MKKKTALIAPSFKKLIYEKTKIKVGVPYSPNLTLATLAAGLLREGHSAIIIDLNLVDSPMEYLKEQITRFNPDYAGITFTTPLFYEMAKISELIKTMNPRIIVMGGGAHASSLPEDTLNDSSLDIVAVQEGDLTLLDVVDGKKLNSIDGIYYREGSKIIKNPARKYIEDLDMLPYPAWNLFDLSKYKTTRLLARKNPVAWLETSRGCVFGCTYCNKSVFGRTFRVKSPARVVDEMEHLLKSGFKEIHIADDMFTTDIERAKTICREIITRKMKVPWVSVTGIRVHPFDEELAGLMKKAGCYRILFGIESGNQLILDNIKKNITLEQVRNAVKICKKARLETFGAFMLALPGETEKTMQNTIDFAVELDVDLAKVTITTPLPATPLYNELQKKGNIKTKDWSKFNMYLPANDIYDHPNLDWKVVEKYYNRFYRRFYLRPGYIFKTFINSLRRGNLFYYISYFFKTKW
ncbi:MAG: B12-binding domain-containing radical SAM protein [Elusimicrobia bacterium]|nr:B12-binding domain-containing radical SAM protein [Elusimicrobiota bacterium]